LLAIGSPIYLELEYDLPSTTSGSPACSIPGGGARVSLDPFSLRSAATHTADERHGQQEQGGGAAAPLLPLPGRDRLRRGVCACCIGDLSSWLSSLLHFLLELLCPAPISTTLKIIDANGIDDDGEEPDKGGAHGHQKHKVI